MRPKKHKNTTLKLGETFMEILTAIVQLLGGLALFLYGIELIGD